MLGDEHLYGNMPKETIDLFKAYNTTAFSITDTPVPDGMLGIGMHNNPDLVIALIKIGYCDLLFGNHKKYAHILEKDNNMIFVDNSLALRCYFG